MTEPLLSELSRAAGVGHQLPDLRRTCLDDLPAELLRDDLRLPEVGELDVVRHFTHLSQLQLLDRRGLLPARLVHDEVQPAGQRGRRAPARLRRTSTRCSPTRRSRARCGDVRAAADCWRAITGFDAVTLQPAAGAQGELAGDADDPRLPPGPRRRARDARCWCPTRRTAPTRPPPRCAAFTPVPIPTDARRQRRPGRAEGRARRHRRSA